MQWVFTISCLMSPRVVRCPRTTLLHSSFLICSDLFPLPGSDLTSIDVITKSCCIVVAVVFAIVALGSTLFLVVLVDGKVLPDDGIKACHIDVAQNDESNTN